MMLLLLLFVWLLPAPVRAVDRWVDNAGGFDTNPCTATTSPTTARKTIGEGAKCLQPGDRLMVKDGTYPPVVLSCGSSGGPVHGSASLPITIQAEHERQARIVSDGSRMALTMFNCQWWNVVGFDIAMSNTTATCVDGNGCAIVETIGVANVSLKRNLVHNTTAAGDPAILIAYDSADVLLEENEVYECFANCVETYAGAVRTTFRRNYMHRGSRPYALLTLYTAGSALLENNVFDVGSNLFNQGTSDVRAFGNLTLSDGSWYWAVVQRHNQYGPNVSGVIHTHNVGMNVLASSYISSTQEATITHETALVGSGGGGFASDNKYDSRNGPNNCCTADGSSCPPTGGITCPWVINPNLTFKDSLITPGSATGVSITHSTQYPVLVLDHLDVYGHPTNYGPGTGGRTNSVSVDAGMGSCVAWMPDASPMKGQASDGTDHGARILYRYQDGVLQTTPLWDTTTGAFPCGAVVPGVNDGALACRNVHTRLHINTPDCPFPAGYGGPVSTETLLAYWQCDESSGTTAHDSGPRGDLNPAALSAGAGFGLPRKGAHACTCDGLTGQLNVNGLIANSGPTAVSVTLWADLSSMPDANYGSELLSLGDRLGLHVNGTGPDWSPSVTGIFTTTATSGVFNEGVTVARNMVGTGWHHYSFVVDPANGSEQLYIDGVWQAQKTTSGALRWDGGAPDTRLCVHATNPNKRMAGSLDDVKIWGKALSASEIQQEYGVKPPGRHRMMGLR